MATLNQAGLSAGYFGEAVLTVGYLWNLTGTRILPDSKTPFEMLYGYKPDMSHLRVFGSRCFSRIPPERRTKNGPHSLQALFMGYPDGIKGWRLRDCVTGAFSSHSCRFAYAVYITRALHSVTKGGSGTGRATPVHSHQGVNGKGEGTIFRTRVRG